MFEAVELYKNVPKPQKPGGSPKRGSDESAKIPIPPTTFTVMVARLLFWGFALLLITSVTAILGGIVALISPNDSAIAPILPLGDREESSQHFGYSLSRPINILVMGVDLPTEPNSSHIFTGRSDTTLLVRFNPNNHSIYLLSIPRDTRVEIPGLGVAKINEINPAGGAALTSRVISSTLNYVPIDRYLRISTVAFRELVNLLGGVEVLVPKAMSYTDITQQFSINLRPGWQTLDGEQAEQFARFRNDELGDIGRIQRQQSLMKALLDRLTSPSVVPRVPQIVRIMQKYLDTNLSLEETFALVNFSLQIQPTHFQMMLLPGEFRNSKRYKTSFWIIDSLEIKQMMQQYFNVSTSHSSQSTYLRNTASDLPPGKLKIAIQNGTNDSQIGSILQQYLQNKGFENVYVVEDWPIQQRQTQIIVQKGDLQGAVILKNLLGFGLLEASSTGDLNSDLTIRVGQDWKTQELKIKGEE